MKKTYLTTLTMALLALCAFSMPACNKAEAEKKTDSPRPVKAMKIDDISHESVMTFPGKAQALREVDLAFRVGGPLIELYGDTGTRMKKGEIIARIDPRDFKVRIKTSKAALAASRAQLNEATLQFKRYGNLIKKNAAARSRYDQVKAAYEMAQAQVNADSRNLEAAENALEDTTLKAPFSGFIHVKKAENHETVNQGQPIVSMVDLSAIEIELGIPEYLSNRIPLVKNYNCRFDAYPGEMFSAEIKEMGKKANSSGNTYPLTLTLSPKANKPVLPGMSAEVTLTLEKDDSAKIFTVPVESLVNGHDRKTYVWTMDPEKNLVNKKIVITHGFRSGLMEISGEIKPGDLVVTAGANYLKEGMAVKPLPPASDTNIGEML